MILKLDPRHPVVWRTPTSLQVGIDPPLVRLDDVSETQERLLAAMVVGVSGPGLTMIAGGDGVARDTVMTALTPAMETVSPLPARTVSIVGVGPLVDALAHALGRSAVHVEVAAGAEELADDGPDLAVLVHHFVTPPALHGLWLRRDVPHLPIVFSDGGVQVGPLVEPGDGPCLLCLELHRRDADPAWPAIATQLLGRRAWAERPALVLDAAGLACRLVLERLAGVPGLAVATRIDADSGSRVDTAWAYHPECGCQGIEHLLVPESATAGRRETGWAGAALDRVPR